MARPREFDTDHALDGAMEIFWRKGYKATSLPSLLRAMGVTRGSFYKAFADKEAIYFQTLERYDTEVVSSTLQMLEACEAPQASTCLLPMFTQSGTADRGCFICNAMVEVAPNNPKVAAKTQEMADRLKEGIRSVLEKRKVGSSTAHRDELAEVVLHLYFGVQAMGKSGRVHEDWSARLKRLLMEEQPS
ncbi:TetR/AcrR family transcriptional regulator [Shimia sp. NS0008-38b]|uniref:TetR/AcrR family transcriptional regulator n=1 Tax=Shimia sp. NS0008-38b TaxID=3127653 RepID=UPI00334226A0